MVELDGPRGGSCTYSPRKDASSRLGGRCSALFKKEPRSSFKTEYPCAKCTSNYSRSAPRWAWKVMVCWRRATRVSLAHVSIRRIRNPAARGSSPNSPQLKLGTFRLFVWDDPPDVVLDSRRQLHLFLPSWTPRGSSPQSDQSIVCLP